MCVLILGADVFTAARPQASGRAPTHSPGEGLQAPSWLLHWCPPSTHGAEAQGPNRKGFSRVSCSSTPASWDPASGPSLAVSQLSELGPLDPLLLGSW